MKIIWHWLLLSLALYFTARIFPREMAFSPAYVVLVVAACLYFINATVKPIIAGFTFTINILTLGIFSIIINALVFWALTYVVNGFYIADFQAAIIGSVIVSVFNWVLEMIFN